MNDLSHGQHHEPTAEQQWEQFTALKTADDYHRQSQRPQP